MIGHLNDALVVMTCSEESSRLCVRTELIDAPEDPDERSPVSQQDEVFLWGTEPRKPVKEHREETPETTPNHGIITLCLTLCAALH